MLKKKPKLITHQQPVTTKAKKSIANFKLRSGKTIGCKITIRNNAKIKYLEKSMVKIVEN